jgi:uncharacterized protein (TIGR02466 family)
MNELQEIRPFYTAIYSTTLEVDNSLLQNVILKNKTEDSGVVVSNVGGWQSKVYDDAQTPCMIDLLDKIMLYVNAVYDVMKVNVKSPTLKGYWFNVNGKYNYNITHSHSPCFYSAIYYVKCPKNSGSLHFVRSDLLTEVVEFCEANEKNYGEYYLQPSVGSLYIFPSFLKHYVTQNLSEEEDSERISIAFNFK